jgi:SAM-dependent methyltransferase
MDWDSRYRAGELGPSGPHRLVIEAANLLPPGRALDLACGAGRNAQFLGERGWSVIGVDASVAALQVARGARTVLADLERHHVPFRDELFDIVIIINFLHRPLFAEAVRVVKKGGVVAAAIRTTGHYSLPPGELRRLFDGCRIFVDRDGEIIAIKDGAA